VSASVLMVLAVILGAAVVARSPSRRRLPPSASLLPIPEVASEMSRPRARWPLILIGVIAFGFCVMFVIMAILIGQMNDIR